MVHEHQSVSNGDYDHGDGNGDGGNGAEMQLVLFTFTAWLLISTGAYELPQILAFVDTAGAAVTSALAERQRRQGHTKPALTYANTRYVGLRTTALTSNPSCLLRGKQK